MNCFLIDDDLDDQEIFCMALRDIDPEIQCMIAGDGREGIEKLRLLGNNFHDFIFIDLNMPRMNGFETLAAIKNLPFVTNAKIIIYSTTSDQHIIEQALQAGATEFLVKPASIQDLKAALRSIFGSKKTTE